MQLTSGDSIATQLLKIAELYPERPALRILGREYSYQALFIYGKKLAMYLQKYPDLRCLILAERSEKAYIALLASILAGKTYVFLSGNEDKSKIRTLLSNIDTDLILTDAEIGIFLSKPSKEKYQLPEKVSVHVYFMMTSGSTGEPKIIPISHANLMAYVENISLRNAPKKEDRISQISELSFDFSVHDIFLAWSQGACLSVFTQNAMSLPNWIYQEKISFLAIVPSMMRLLISCNRNRVLFENVRYTAFCGERLTDALARQWHKLACHSVIDNLYGPTEATVAISAFRWTPTNSDEQVSIGQAFPNQEILLRDEDGNLIESDTIGEILLLGSQITRAYWNNESLNEKAFIEIRSKKSGKMQRAYRSGDLAFFDKMRNLHYVGRKDDQFKVRGYRIEKIEIETSIQKIAQTELVAVIIHPKLDTNEIFCFVAKSPFKISEIFKLCRQKLSSFMQPKRIFALDDLPYNKSGKIDYQRLKTMSVAYL